MNKEWDKDKGGRDAWIIWLAGIMTECYRLLKPGAHALVWALPRTSHWTAIALEEAGFEIRDVGVHLFGTGFPKSLDVSKAIDKSDAGIERRRRDLAFTAWMRGTGITASEINELTGSRMGGHYLTGKEQPAVATSDMFERLRPSLPAVPVWVEQLVRDRTVESENYKRREVIGERKTGIGTGRGSTSVIQDNEANRAITEAHSPEARAWTGWGTALKPAAEHWILARKPLEEGTVAANVLEWGAGALNIEGCRVSDTGLDGLRESFARDLAGQPQRHVSEAGAPPKTPGRWPANVTLDEEAAAVLDAQTGISSSRKGKPRGSTKAGEGWGMTKTGAEYDDSGGASRFFYTAKASRADREYGCENLPKKGAAANHHPTVKPQSLMRWLARLITPPSGLILDPFAGTGSTGIAALLEGFRFIGVEASPEYTPIAQARLSKALKDTETGE